MALTIFTEVPENELMSAYRPIKFTIKASIVTEIYPIDRVIYCDVYAAESLGSIATPPKFLRTITSTTRTLPLPSVAYFDMDIQDVMQEYMQGNQHPAIGSLSITTRDRELVRPNFCMCVCFFRVAEKNADGFLVPNVPQAYGSGVPSKVFKVLNAVQQQEDKIVLSQVLNDNMSFPKVENGAFILSSYRSGRFIKDWDYLSFLPTSVLGGGISTTRITYEARLKSGGVEHFCISAIYPLVVDLNGVYAIPLGEKFIKKFATFVYFPLSFTMGAPYTPDFSRYESIGAKLIDFSTMTTILTIQDVIPVHCKKGKTLRFLNSFGGFDDIHFKDSEEAKQVQNEFFQRPSTYPTDISDGGFMKIGGDSNEVLNLRTIAYGYNNARWLSELLDSPQIYDLTDAGASPKQIPMNILSADVIIGKLTEKWVYELSITAEYANHNIRQRR